MFDNADYFPTPDKLIEKMIEKIDLSRHKYILEPSGGKGNIVEVVRNKTKHSRYGQPVIDVIEYDPFLQSVLKDRGGLSINP